MFCEPQVTDLPPAVASEHVSLPPIGNVSFDGERSFQPLPELVQGMLPFEGVAFLGGQSGAGKTFIAIDLAVSLATGQEFFGRKVRERVGVVIIAAEGAGTLPQRIECARRQREANEWLAIATIDSVGNFIEDVYVQDIAKKLVAIDARFRQSHGVRVGLIIVDTVAAAFSMADENSNADAAKVVQIIRRLSAATGALVLAVHHYGKSADTGLRGASAFRGGADAIISVLGTRDETRGTCTGRSIAVAKSRTSYEGPVSGFELREVELGVNSYGEIFGSCAIVAGELPVTSEKAAPSLAVRVFSEAFQTALTDNGCDHQINSNGNGNSPRVRAVTVNHVRDEYLRRKVTGEEDSKKQRAAALKAFGRTLDKLPVTYTMEVSGDVEWIWARQ